MKKLFANRSLLYVTLASGFLLILTKWEGLREGPVSLSKIFLLSYLAAIITAGLLFFPWAWSFSKINSIKRNLIRWPIKAITGTTAFFIFLFLNAMISVPVGLDKAETRNKLFASCFGFQANDQKCMKTFDRYIFDIASFPDSEIDAILKKVGPLLISSADSYGQINKGEGDVVHERLKNIIDKQGHRDAIKEIEKLFYGFPNFNEHIVRREIASNHGLTKDSSDFKNKSPR